MMVRKRVGAFFIDMLLVSLLAITLSGLSYLNPYKEKYEKVTDEYKEVLYEYQSVLTSEGSSSITNLKVLNEYLNTSIIPVLKNIEKYSIFYSLWYLIVYFLYFGIFTFFNDGQTLGKKIFKIRVVNKGSNKLSFNRVLRRCLINGTSLYYGINIILIFRILSTFINDTYIFTNTYFILEFLSIALELSLVISLFFSKGTRLTNDLFAQTEIIEAK